MATDQPENYDIRTLQLHLLRMLSDIKEVFARHGLRWYMVDGTLLGAVRDKGFIPWDDDVDIAMPRRDYEMLIQNAARWLPDPYEFVCYETDPSYPQHFGKIQDASTTLIERPHLYYLGGVYIDIFPIDGAPDGMLARKLYDMRYQALRKLLYFRCRDPYRHGKGAASWWPRMVRKMYSVDSLQRKIRNWMMKYPLEESNTAAVNHNDGLGSMVDRRKVLGNPVMIPFENIEAPALADSHAYLSQLFGDYMTPPPPGKRHIHRFHYLDLEHPYRDFDEQAYFAARKQQK